MRKNMKRVYILFFLFLVGLLKAENIIISDLGTKNGGLGYTGVSYYADVPSVLYNPALLVLSPQGKFNLEYTYNQKKLFNLFNMNYQCSLDNKTALGFNFIYYKPKEEIIYDDNGYIQEIRKESKNMINVAGGFTVNKIMLGINFKIINYSDFNESSTLASIDTGLVYILHPLSKNLCFGMNLMNWLKTTGEFRSQTIQEPFNLKAGLSYIIPSPKHGFLITAEVNSRKDDYSLYAFGLEYTLFKIFNLRMGYNEKQQFTAGTGFQYRSYSVNYSFDKKNENDQINHKISFTYFFPAQLSETEKEIYYNRGIRYYNDFNFKNAFKYFKPLYISDKNYRETEYYYNLLEKRLIQKIQEDQKQLNEADDLYQEAVSYYKQKDNTKAINKLAECLKKNRNHQDAKNLLHRISQIEKDRRNQEQAQAREKEGDSYFLQAHYPSALVEYTEALKLDPSNQDLQKKIDESKTQLSKQDVKSIAMQLYQEGEGLFKAGEYTKAIMKWNEALIANPSFIQIRDKIKETQDIVKKLEEERVFDKIVVDKITSLKGTAKYKFEHNELSQALFDVEEILDLIPENPEMKNLKMEIINKINEREKQGNIKKAQLENEYFNKAVKIESRLSSEEIAYNLSMVIALNPSKGKSIKELNALLSKMNQIRSTGEEKASSEYRLILQHFWKGLDFYKQNDLESAYQEWHRGSEINVQPARVKMVDASLAEVQKSQEDKFIQYQLIQSEKLAGENKKEQALEEAKKVLVIMPENKAATEIIKKCTSGTNKIRMIREHMDKANELAQRSQYPDAISELKLVLIMDKENKQAKDKLLEYETSLNRLKAASAPQNSLELAYNYFTSENYNNAREEVNKVLNADKNNVKAKKLLDMIEEKEVKGDLEGIKRRKIMELYSQGVTLFINTDYDGCLQSMKTIMEMDPDNVQALKFIEKAKAKIAEKAENMTVKKESVVNKKLVWEYYYKGINYYLNDDLDRAINEWRQALKLDPTNSKVKTALNKAFIKKETLENDK